MIDIQNKSANCQKIDVGPTLLFQPNYDIVVADIWPISEKDDIQNKSANDQKIDVGPTSYFDLIMISQN